MRGPIIARLANSCAILLYLVIRNIHMRSPGCITPPLILMGQTNVLCVVADLLGCRGHYEGPEERRGLGIHAFCANPPIFVGRHQFVFEGAGEYGDCGGWNGLGKG